MGGDVRDLGEGAAGRHLHPGDLAQLTDDHEHRDAGHVAGQHGFGQQVGHVAEAGQPADHADHADRDGQSGGRGGRQRGVAGGHGGDGHGGHQRGGRLGADGQGPRRAEEGVEQQRADRRPQSLHRRQPGQLRVRHHLGDQVRGHGQTGDHVAAQPGAFVVPDLPRAGQEGCPPWRRDPGSGAASTRRRLCGSGHGRRLAVTTGGRTPATARRRPAPLTRRAAAGARRQPVPAAG